MAVYLTKVWGFSVPEGPLCFGQRGWRERARSMLMPGDTVILVGTLGKNTAPENRGKILGMMEPSSVPVLSSRQAPAYTYAMAIDGPNQPSIKIGWAFDYSARQRQFNLAALPDLGGVKYRPILHHLWDTARQAFRMEQAILKEFDARRHPSNREVIHRLTEAELTPVWTQLLRQLRRRQSSNVSNSTT